MPPTFLKRDSGSTTYAIAFIIAAVLIVLFMSVALGIRICMFRAATSRKGYSYSSNKPRTRSHWYGGGGDAGCSATNRGGYADGGMNGITTDAGWNGSNGGSGIAGAGAGAGSNMNGGGC
jgi:hypothetical protein